MDNPIPITAPINDSTTEYFRIMDFSLLFVIPSILSVAICFSLSLKSTVNIEINTIIAIVCVPLSAFIRLTVNCSLSALSCFFIKIEDISEFGTYFCG